MVTVFRGDSQGSGFALAAHPGVGGLGVAVSQPLHFAATVILGSPQVDFVAWMLTPVGMGIVARELVRESGS